jgi:hypothetical protein
MFMFMYPMLSYRHHYCGEKQLALYVKSVTEKNAIIITADQLPFIEYYGHRAVVALPFGESPVLSDFVVKVSGFLKKGVPVYYTESPWYINIELAERLSVKKYFKINFVGEVLSEDFHNPELGFCLDYQKIFKVDLKESIKLSESPDVPRP